LQHLKTSLLLLLALLLCGTLAAQSGFRLYGYVADKTGQTVEGVPLYLRYPGDTLRAMSDDSGYFYFSNVRSRDFSISIRTSGIDTFFHDYHLTAKAADSFMLDTIIVNTQFHQLQHVNIVASPVTVKEDTIEFRADAYKTREGAVVEDVLKKISELTVDKDGNVTINGQAISKLKVNGKDFFGGNVTTATKNIPANMISKIQVIDDYGYQAGVTGIKTGEPQKVLNLTLKSDKNIGGFGNLTLGGGNQDRYLGSAMLNYFNDSRQITLMGEANNINVNALSYGYGNTGGGVTISKSAGLNYVDKFGEKISLYGSYSYAQQDTRVSSYINQQDVNPANTRITERSTNNDNGNYNHRADLNFDYKVDENNAFHGTLNGGLSGTSGSSSDMSRIYFPETFTTSNNTARNTGTTPSAGATLNYSHKFSKKGRVLFTSASYSYFGNNADNSLNNTYDTYDSTQSPIIPVTTRQVQHIINDNKTVNTGFTASYTEPITESTRLDFNYDLNRSAISNDHAVYNVDSITGAEVRSPVQSNAVDYHTMTNKFGLNLKHEKKRYNATLGFSLQSAALDGELVGKNVALNYNRLNVAPILRFVFNLKEQRKLIFNANALNRLPTIYQIQPTVDSSNYTNIIYGNPNLKSEFTNSFGLSYNNYDKNSGRSLNTNLNFATTQNKIVSVITNDPSGLFKKTSYTNVDGFYALNANANYAIPFHNRRYTLSFNSSGSFTNNITFTDGQQNNGRNYVFRAGTRFNVNLPDIIELNAELDYTLNYALMQYAGDNVGNQAQTYLLNISGKNYFFKDLGIGYNYAKTINIGFNNGTNNPDNLNLYLEYRCLKHKVGTFKLQGFNIFNQVPGSTRTISGTSIIDSRYNTLGRCIILTFTLRIQKFQAPPAEKDPAVK